MLPGSSTGIETNRLSRSRLSHVSASQLIETRDRFARIDTLPCAYELVSSRLRGGGREPRGVIRFNGDNLKTRKRLEQALDKIDLRGPRDCQAANIFGMSWRDQLSCFAKVDECSRIPIESVCFEVEASTRSIWQTPI